MAQQERKAQMIAVMGASGSGKSTFINLVSGSNFSVDEWKTVEVVDESKRFILDGRPVTLIDTPGFDNTGIRYDTEILNWISLYLTQTHGPNATLAGIIYLHNISDPQMIGTSERNFRSFRTLCGEKTLRKVLVVTTKWSEVDPAVGRNRERELATSNDLFKPVLDEGGQILRYNGTLRSAHAILRRLIPPIVDEGNSPPGLASLTQRVQDLEAEVMELRQQMDEMLAKDQSKSKGWFSWW